MQYTDEKNDMYGRNLEIFNKDGVASALEYVGGVTIEVMYLPEPERLERDGPC